MPFFKSKHKNKNDPTKDITKYLTIDARLLIDYINHILRDDSDLKDILPLEVNSNIFEKFKSGVLLCKIVNAIFPGSINFEDVELKKDLNTFDSISNINFAIKGAKSAECKVNIKADDIILNKPKPILDFLWVIIKTGLLKKVSLQCHPELMILIGENESITSFMKTDPEKILLRWFNYHLERVGHSKIENFGSDLSDGRKLLILLEQVSPDGFIPHILHEEPCPKKRAQLICEIASILDVHKFVSVDTILNGYEEINMAFTAYLFDKYPGLRRTKDNNVTTRESQLMRIRETEKADFEYQELLNRQKLLLQENKQYNEKAAHSKDSSVLPADITQPIPNLNMYPSSNQYSTPYQSQQVNYSPQQTMNYPQPQQTMNYPQPQQTMNYPQLQQTMNYPQPQQTMNYSHEYQSENPNTKRYMNYSQSQQNMVYSQLMEHDSSHFIPQHNISNLYQKFQPFYQPEYMQNPTPYVASSSPQTPPPLPPRTSNPYYNQQEQYQPIFTTQFSPPQQLEYQKFVITKTTTTIRKK